MIGAVEYRRLARGPSWLGNEYVSTINGHIGMWGLWNRALKDEEINFLRKEIVSVWEETDNSLEFVPRLFDECIGRWSTLTGGTGLGLPEGATPLLYGENSLVAWWDGTTGDTSIGNGLIDIHTGEFHLTGSGMFSGVERTYNNASRVTLANPTSPDPRFGGFPGTDGFSYNK